MNAQVTVTRRKALFGATLLTVVSFATITQAQQATSALVRQMYDGGWPDKQTVEQLNKDRLYQRAIEAYMMTIPALNMIGIRDGSEAKFAKGYNVLPIWKDRMNAKTLIPTPNSSRRRSAGVTFTTMPALMPRA